MQPPNQGTTTRTGANEHDPGASEQRGGTRERRAWLTASVVATSLWGAGCGNLKGDPGRRRGARHGPRRRGQRLHVDRASRSSPPTARSPRTTASIRGRRRVASSRSRCRGTSRCRRSPSDGGDLWLIDRGNAALTILAPTTCAVTGQVSVGDGLQVEPARRRRRLGQQGLRHALRDERRRPRTRPPTGDDILILDRASGAATGRIDLSGYASPVDGASTQARPDRMVIADGQVFVTLGSQDAKFSGDGRGPRRRHRSVDRRRRGRDRARRASRAARRCHPAGRAYRARGVRWLVRRHRRSRPPRASP